MTIEKELSTVDRKINYRYLQFLENSIKKLLNRIAEYDRTFFAKKASQKFIQQVFEHLLIGDERIPNPVNQSIQQCVDLIRIIFPQFESIVKNTTHLKIFNTQDFFSLQNPRKAVDDLPFEFVVAHGCAGTKHQQIMREKLDVYYKAIKTLHPNTNIIHFLLGDNVYRYGCQNEHDTTFEQYFHNIYSSQIPHVEGPIFPWDFGVGILGNHDYNYINPLLRKLFAFWVNPIRSTSGPNIAFNQISQSYDLCTKFPEQYKVPLIPSRYFLVETKFALFFCLDTNVLLFDVNQQRWLHYIIRRVSENPDLRKKNIVITCHQPLQTFGKRSRDNGDFGYYASTLTDQRDKDALSNLIFALLPHYVAPQSEKETPKEFIFGEMPAHPGSKIPARIPHSILLRRYLERAFLSNDLHISIILSAHDHFNELSVFGEGIGQVIAGVMGIEKDPQNDRRSEIEIEKLKKKKSRGLEVFSPLTRFRERAITTPVPSPQESILSSLPIARMRSTGIAKKEDVATLTFGLTMACPEINPNTSSQEQPLRQGQIATVNTKIREQFTLPLCIISPETIKVVWQWYPTTPNGIGSATVTEPIIFENPNLISNSSFIMRTTNEIEHSLDFITKRFEIIHREYYKTDKTYSEHLRTLKSTYENLTKQLEAIEQTFTQKSGRDERSIEERGVNRAFAIVHCVTPIINNMYAQTTAILDKNNFFLRYIEFYQELHYILMDTYCLCMSVLEHRMIPSAPRSRASDSTTTTAPSSPRRAHSPDSLLTPESFIHSPRRAHSPDSLLTPESFIHSPRENGFEEQNDAGIVAGISVEPHQSFGNPDAWLRIQNIAALSELIKFYLPNFDFTKNLGVKLFDDHSLNDAVFEHFKNFTDYPKVSSTIPTRENVLEFLRDIYPIIRQKFLLNKPPTRTDIPEIIHVPNKFFLDPVRSVTNPALDETIRKEIYDMILKADTFDKYLIARRNLAEKF